MDSLVFRVMGTTGLDTLAMIFLPERMVARRFAKKLLRTIWKDANPASSYMVVELPTGSYRVIDVDGSVQPCRRAGVQ